MNYCKLRKNIYVIAGSTSSGKSSLAIQLAKYLDAWIINGDSRQVYNGLTIGSAQPIPDSINKDKSWTVNGVKHFLYGHIKISDDYSVAQYQEDVFNLLKSYPTKKFIIVGGSGLFIDSVIYKYDFTQNNRATDIDALKRENLIKLSTEELQSLIAEVELNQLNESDRLNPARLIRVIERGMPKRQERKTFDNYFLLELPKDFLLSRIEKRINLMFDNGLLKEVTTIWEKYNNFNLKSLKSIGYQEFKDYFEKKISINEVKDLINTHTRQYAKRQKTWFNKNSDAKKVQNLEEIIKYLITLQS